MPILSKVESIETPLSLLELIQLSHSCFSIVKPKLLTINRAIIVNTDMFRSVLILAHFYTSIT